MAAATLLTPASDRSPRRALQPDTELIELGRRFEASWAVERALDAEFDVAPEADRPSLEDLLLDAGLRTKAIAEKIDASPASSLDGLIVKIRVASWCHSGRPIDPVWLAEAGWIEEDDPATDCRIVLSILRDLATIGGRRPTAECAPEAEAA